MFRHGLLHRALVVLAFTCHRGTEHLCASTAFQCSCCLEVAPSVPTTVLPAQRNGDKVTVRALAAQLSAGWACGFPATEEASFRKAKCAVGVREARIHASAYCHPTVSRDTLSMPCRGHWVSIRQPCVHPQLLLVKQSLVAPCSAQQ